MILEGQEVCITSREYWFKIVEFLQQNWALIDSAEGNAVVWFFLRHFRSFFSNYAF
jgi:hypothetical protein